MLDTSGPIYQVVLFLLIVWATTGLTIIHLGVLGYRMVEKVVRPTRRVPAAPAQQPAGGDPPPLSLTFLVPVYNDGMTVGTTIESLLRQSVRPTRIVVVNDGSTDDTPQVIERYRDEGVELLHLEQNVGKSRALDIALRQVDTDLVAITDADSVVDVDYTRHMLESFRDPEMCAVGGVVESIPHTWVTAARQIEYMMTVHIDRNAEDKMGALVVLPGVSSTYRTKVLREMGFEFDTIAEDFDLTFRLQRANRKIGMNMQAKVFTSDPPTLKTYYKQLTRWYTDFWLVLKKHRAVLGKRVFGTVEVPMLMLNATVASALYLTLPVFLLFTDPSKILVFLAMGLAFDAALIALAWRVYRRTDVWWALVSRIPTRVLSRTAFLLSMVRVLIGKPGLAWDKLERRRTDAFLADGGAGPLAIPPVPAADSTSATRTRESGHA